MITRGPYAILLTIKWSPTIRLFSILDEGILNSSKTKPRISTAAINAKTIDSVQSRTSVIFSGGSVFGL